jgi:hypothetical protein
LVRVARIASARRSKPNASMRPIRRPCRWRTGPRR